MALLLEPLQQQQNIVGQEFLEFHKGAIVDPLMTLPDIGGRARDMIKGGALLGLTAVERTDGSGVASRVESEGRLLVLNRGADKASGTVSVLGPPSAAGKVVVVKPGKSGMVDMEAGGGGTKGVTAVLAGTEPPAGIHGKKWRKSCISCFCLPLALGVLYTCANLMSVRSRQ